MPYLMNISSIFSMFNFSFMAEMIALSSYILPHSYAISFGFFPSSFIYWRYSTPVNFIICAKQAHEFFVIDLISMFFSKLSKS